MPRMPRRIALLVLALVAQACDRGPSPGQAKSRDSAGIRIVENAGPAWDAAATWKVIDSPLVDIGARSGDPAYELDQVRGPLRLSDGRLAIVNAVSNEIRFYDAGGKHLRSTGRAGSGPGEYRSFAGIWLGAGDSLLVADIIARRITVLDRDGNVGRSFALEGQSGQFVPIGGKVEVGVPVGLFADGSLVSLSRALSINQQRSGVYRDSVTLIHYGPDGTLRDTLGRFPGEEMEQMTLMFGGRSMASPVPVPLGKQSLVLVDRDRLIVAQNSTWELELRGADGKLRTLVRAPVKPTPLSPSDIAAHRKQQLAVMDATPMFRSAPEAFKTQLRARVEQANYPSTLPFFASLLADPDGNVWAEEASSPTHKAKRFVVVDSTGRWLGTVSFPADFRPTFIAPGAVYGVWTDDDAVEHVRGYPLHKPQGR